MTEGKSEMTAAARKARRNHAIKAYQNQAERAEAMGHGSRVCQRPLASLSASEIENAAWTLGRALDKLAPVAG